MQTCLYCAFRVNDTVAGRADLARHVKRAHPLPTAVEQAVLIKTIDTMVDEYRDHTQMPRDMAEGIVRDALLVARHSATFRRHVANFQEGE